MVAGSLLRGLNFTPIHRDEAALSVGLNLDPREQGRNFPVKVGDVPNKRESSERFDYLTMELRELSVPDRAFGYRGIPRVCINSNGIHHFVQGRLGSPELRPEFDAPDQ